MTAARKAVLLAPMDRKIADFDWEFLWFLRDRVALRRLVLTPDCSPLLCELIDAAKNFYVRLPRTTRNSVKSIPFSYFQREWEIRMNSAARPRPGDVYIDLCCAGSRAVLVTVAVRFDNDSLEAMTDA